MGTLKSLWTVLWKIAIAAGFAGIGVLGVGLMIAVFWYPTGIFWGAMVFLIGLLGVLLAAGMGLTMRQQSATRSSAM